LGDNEWDSEFLEDRHVLLEKFCVNEVVKVVREDHRSFLQKYYRQGIRTRGEAERNPECLHSAMRLTRIFTNHDGDGEGHDPPVIPRSIEGHESVTAVDDV